MPISSHTMPIRSARSFRSGPDEPGDGLVENGQPGVGGQGPGQVHQTLLAGAQGGHGPVGQGLDAEELEKLESVPPGQAVVVLGQGEAQAAGQEATSHPAVLGHHEVLGGRHRLEQGRAGEHPGHPQPAALVGGQARHVPLAEVDPAGRRGRTR